MSSYNIKKISLITQKILLIASMATLIKNCCFRSFKSLPAERFFTSCRLLSRKVNTSASPDSQTSQYINTIINPYTVETYARPNVIITHGKGSYLYDLENQEYIDFGAGIAVTCLGHADSKVTEIISQQAASLMHCSNLYHNLPAGELVNKLVTKTIASKGMADAQRVYLCNSGTEANEAAMKFARKYGKSIDDQKCEFITFENSFHGRTFGSLSVTPNAKYQDPFLPLVPGVKVAKVNDISSVEKHIDKSKTCAVIIEPIQGEGGVNPVDTDFMIALKKLCVKNDVLLIFDEIQCGLGRTGNLWAHCEYPKEAHPDIVTMAKALGNGFPIGATMISEKVEKALKVGDHGTTYGGNPLGSKIGCHIVDQVSDKAFLDAVSMKSEKFIKGFTKIQKSFPDHIVLIKGKGLLLGVEFSSSLNVSDVVAKCRDNGLFVISAGMNTLRIVPALNIPNETIEEGLQILTDSIKEIVQTSKV